MKFVKSLFLTLCFFGCSKAAVYNNQGVVDLYFEDYESAKTSFIKALVYDPGSIYSRYNLSLTDLSRENLVAAEKELKFLEKSIWSSKDYEDKPKDLYRVLFAQAFVQTMLKDIPAALSKYQECLELRPNSIDVKKNIELLMSSQQSQSGQQGKKQNSKSDSKKGDQDSKDKKQEGQDDKNNDEKDKGEKKSDEDIKGRDDSTLKRKNLSEKEREQILKEIKSQESKIRSQENNKYKGEGAGGKTW